MAEIGGSITLNGITDAQLIIILEVKEKNPQVHFNPQTLQAAQQNVGGTVRQFYNNATLNWQPAGLQTIRDLMTRLIESK